ncbi:MAG: hypothetical protein PHP06_07510 [Clostridia bacterium]|nr:hypothetical protein [Clostridia bacterium]
MDAKDAIDRLELENQQADQDNTSAQGDSTDRNNIEDTGMEIIESVNGSPGTGDGGIAYILIAFIIALGIGVYIITNTKISAHDKK